MAVSMNFVHFSFKMSIFHLCYKNSHVVCIMKIHKLFVYLFTRSEHKLWYCMYNQYLRTCKVPPCWCIQLLLAEMAFQLRDLMPCLCMRFQRRFQQWVRAWSQARLWEWGRVTASLCLTLSWWVVLHVLVLRLHHCDVTHQYLTSLSTIVPWPTAVTVVTIVWTSLSFKLCTLISVNNIILILLAHAKKVVSRNPTNLVV